MTKFLNTQMSARWCNFSAILATDGYLLTKGGSNQKSLGQHVHNDHWSKLRLLTLKPVSEEIWGDAEI